MRNQPFRFAVRVKPGARREAVGGRWDGTSGTALIVKVAAPAVDGKANDALRRVLAVQFGVPRRDVQVVAGEHRRYKLIELNPVPAGAAARLDLLLAR